MSILGFREKYARLWSLLAQIYSYLFQLTTGTLGMEKENDKAGVGGRRRRGRRRKRRERGGGKRGGEQG